MDYPLRTIPKLPGYSGKYPSKSEQVTKNYLKGCECLFLKFYILHLTPLWLHRISLHYHEIT